MVDFPFYAHQTLGPVVLAKGVAQVAM